MIQFLGFSNFQVSFEAFRIFDPWIGQSIPPAVGI
jgi:hypothetical protein